MAAPMLQKGTPPLYFLCLRLGSSSAVTLTLPASHILKVLIIFYVERP